MEDNNVKQRKSVQDSRTQAADPDAESERADGLADVKEGVAISKVDKP